MADSSDIPSNPLDRPKASLPRRSLASRASSQATPSTPSSPPPILPPPPAQTVPIAIFQQLQMEHTDTSRRLLDETVALANELRTKQQEYDQLLATKLSLEQEVAALKAARQNLVVEKTSLEVSLEELHTQLDTHEVAAKMHGQETSSLHSQVDALNNELLALEFQAGQEVDLLQLEKRSLEAFLAANPPAPAGPPPAAPLHSVTAALNAVPMAAWMLLILLFVLAAVLASIWVLGWAERSGAFGLGGPDIDFFGTRLFALLVVVCGDLLVG